MTQHPLPCPAWRDLLSAYHDQALAPEERSRVDLHLADCAACRRAVAQMEEDRLRFNAAFAASTGGHALKQHVLETLRGTAPGLSLAHLPRKRWRLYIGLNAATALACLLLFVVIVSTSRTAQKVWNVLNLDSRSMVSDLGPTREALPPSNPHAAPVEEPPLTRGVRLQLEAVDPLATARKAQEIFRDQGGMVTSFTYANDEGNSSATVVRGKVPSAHLADAFGSLTKLGNVRGFSVLGNEFMPLLQPQLDAFAGQPPAIDENPRTVAPPRWAEVAITISGTERRIVQQQALPEHVPLLGGGAFLLLLVVAAAVIYLLLAQDKPPWVLWRLLRRKVHHQE